ncbi:ZIP family metal transporter [Patescibacteria group bacterium]|nr:ZIP family metal transporter [Patescibacteria group bacterium]MBU0879624.1 ZIP family metal transporter [Patescibacteria group bacterium]MBU0880485.1 ZIP family metal transporter [Patescibacteria group bacterium]MBU0897930.1 ZIP family metal transporter [Patescibacteria group bacterium]MBU1062992.1 ZIP family metal transporter [Patescibacteria group bacterium]
MAQIYFYSLISVIIVSLLSFIGVLTFNISEKKLQNLIMFLVSLSAGTLLGDSFLHLMPEALENNKEDIAIWLWLLAGILVFFILEKIIHWRHCHLSTTPNHPHPVGLMNLIGDGLHNFIDGMIIAGSFLINPQLGITTTLAVIAHEIPQEIGDFGILLHAGYSRKKALLLNFASAVCAILGALLILIIGAQINNFITFIIPFTAGGFIYIATADLIPELKKDTSIKKSLLQLSMIILGIAIMLALKKIG